MGVRGEEREKGDYGRDYGRERERERERGYGGGSSGDRGGGGDRQSGDRAREERMKAMDKPQAVSTAAPSYVKVGLSRNDPDKAALLVCG